MTQEDIDELEAALRDQAEESGFFEESAEYLAAVLTDEEYDLDNYECADELRNMTFATDDGTTLTLDELQNMSGKHKVEVSDPTISFHITTTLQHFTGKGVRGELSASFKVSVELNTVGSSTNKLEITCTAVTEQEIVLGMHVAAKSEWKWYLFIPVLQDISVTASFRAGTYTGLGAVCTVQTKSDNNNEDKKWDELISTSNKSIFQMLTADSLKSLGKGLGTLKNALEFKENGVSGTKEQGKAGTIDIGSNISDATESDETDYNATSVGGGLEEKYSEMLSNDDCDYIPILSKQVFSSELSPDPLHLICFSVSASLVFKVKINAMLGFGVSYGNAKQYSFSFSVFKGTSSSSTADLETPNFRADFYAFGMIGIRAGFLLDVRVGLISTKIDSIGVTAEVGFYAEVYGFLYIYYVSA